MTLAFRIIPKLDIKGSDLVKGINLEGLRVLGKPDDFAKYYYNEGADELIYQDVVASLYGRNGLKSIINKTAKEIFIPLTVGGGIRTIEDIKGILQCGADKVSINTAAHEKPHLISKAAEIFGSSTIVVSIEAIKQSNGKYIAFTDNGRNPTGREVIDWAQETVQLGAGEIILTIVDKEGTGKGTDIELINEVSKILKVPFIVHGGLGSINQILETSKINSVSGVALSSVLHYELVSKLRNNQPNDFEGNTQFLKSRKLFTSVQPTTIKKIKQKLNQNNILCR